MANEAIQARRAEDQDGWRSVTCWLAQRASETWEWIDKRDIDKHLVMVLIMWGTIKITSWAMKYVDLHPDDAGADVGLKVGAVLLAWNIIATPAIGWYFKARQ